MKCDIKKNDSYLLSKKTGNSLMYQSIIFFILLSILTTKKKKKFKILFQVKETGSSKLRGWTEYFHRPMMKE